MTMQKTLDDADMRIIRAYLNAEVAEIKYQITQWVGGLLLASSALVVVLLLIFK